jgi:hypothetical protein
MRKLGSFLLTIPLITRLMIHPPFVGIEMDHGLCVAGRGDTSLAAGYAEQALAMSAIMEERRPDIGAIESANIREMLGDSYRPGRHRSGLKRLMTVLVHAFRRYPLLTIKSFLAAAGISRWRHTKSKIPFYRPLSAELADLFDLLDFPIASSGRFLLPQGHSWNDYLVFAHRFAFRLSHALGPLVERSLSVRLRYGVVHSLYNALIYGAPESPILLTWSVTGSFLWIDIANTALSKNIPRQHVEAGGIPISGMGGAIQTMRSLFDRVQLRRYEFPGGMTPKTVLSLAHRLNASGRIWSRWKREIITHLACAKDNLQLMNAVTANLHEPALRAKGV